MHERGSIAFLFGRSLDILFLCKKYDGREKMGCRCDDIDRYSKEMGYLQEALGYSAKLLDNTANVRTALTELGTQYRGTLNTVERFYTKLNKLDENAPESASDINLKIQEAIDRLADMLNSAQIEDAQYDHENNE